MLPLLYLAAAMSLFGQKSTGIVVPVKADAVVTVDFSDRVRDWDGFGVNYVETSQTRDYNEWKQEYGGFSILSEAQRREILDLIFGPDGLRPGLLKMFLDPFHESGHETTTRWMRLFAHEGLKRVRGWGGDLAVLTTLYGPPARMTKQKFVLGRDLDPEYKSQLCEYIADWLQYLLKKENLPVRYVSLHNEGDAYYRWPRDGSNPGEDHRDYNLLWSPEQVVEFLRILRPMLDKHGLQRIGITPGETQTWYRFDEWGYARAIAKDPVALRNLALVTSHSFANYANLKSVYYGDWRSTGTDVLREKKPGLHAWVTSMSWGKMDADFIDNIRRNIYMAGVNGIIPWAIVQRPKHWVGGDPNPGTGIVVKENGTYEVMPGYHYFKQVSRAGQPGMHIAAVTSLDPSVTLIAFGQGRTKRPDAFVLINLSDQDTAVTGTVRGTRATRFQAWRTSPAENYQLINLLATEGGKLSYSAPARSVTTFYATR